MSLNLQDFSALVHQSVDDYLQQECVRLSSFGTSASITHYALFPGGKRIRPVIAALLCHDLGGDWRQCVAPGSGIEVFHGASLVHDDLPALDNDEVRRGKAATHKAFGEAPAIVGGDFMIAFALAVAKGKELSDHQRVLLSDELTRSFMRVCHGQLLDISQGSDRGDLWAIHQHKTGALFGASFAVGAIVAQLSEDKVSHARSSGECFGVLFQILDDLVDRYGTDHARGRLGSSDARNDKVTVTSLRREALEVEVTKLENAMHHGLEVLGGKASRGVLVELLSSTLSPLRMLLQHVPN